MLLSICGTRELRGGKMMTHTFLTSEKHALNRRTLERAGKGDLIAQMREKVCERNSREKIGVREEIM